MGKLKKTRQKREIPTELETFKKRSKKKGRQKHTKRKNLVL